MKLLRADPPFSTGVARSMLVAAWEAWLSGISSSLPPPPSLPSSPSTLDAVIVESELPRRRRRRRGGGGVCCCCCAYCCAPGPVARENGGGRTAVGMGWVAGIGGSRIAARLCGGVRRVLGAVERMVLGRVGVEGRDERLWVPRVWPRGLGCDWDDVCELRVCDRTLSASKIASRPGLSLTAGGFTREDAA